MNCQTYHLFKFEHENVPVGLSQFCDQIPHYMCVCLYHKNVCLILQELSNHTNLVVTFDGFVAQLTYNSSIKECCCHQCEDCKDSLDFFVPTSDATKYQKSQTINKNAEKVGFFRKCQFIDAK